MVELIVAFTLAVGVPVYQAPDLQPLGRYRDHPARILLQPSVVRLIRQGNPCAVFVLAHEVGHHWRGRTNEDGANAWAGTYYGTVAHRLGFTLTLKDAARCQWQRTAGNAWRFG